MSSVIILPEVSPPLPTTVTHTAEPSRAPPIIVYVAVVLIAAFTLFYHLGDRLLWGDEATTAVLAVNVTKFGLPRTIDGRNHITLYGPEIDGNSNRIWVWTPWAAEYLTAASFLMFGEHAFAARLPFAVIALVSVLLLGRLAFKVYGNHQAAAISMLLLATNVPFLLHSRQCRYYALLMLAQIVLIVGYRRLTARRRALGAAVVVVALTLQFYSNYIAFAGSILALCIALPLGPRHRGYVSWMCISLMVAGFFATPWIMYADPAARQMREIAWTGALGNLWYFLNEIHFHLMPLVVLAIPLAARLWRRRSAAQAQTDEAVDSSSAAHQRDYTVRFCWLLLPSHLLVLSLVPLPFFRYVTPLIPVLALLGGGILCTHLRSTRLRYAAVLVLCLSNVVSIVSGWPIRNDHRLDLPYLGFVREILADYEDRTSDVVAFFNEHADPDDRVLVMDPEFALIFHTDVRVIDGRLMSAVTPPDWILSESASGLESFDPLEPQPEEADLYEETAIRVRNTRRGASRPDPHAHERFTTSKWTDLVVYRLRDKGPSASR